MRQFDPRFFSCRLGRCKPDRAVYDAALRNIRCAAAETAMIDDRQENLDGARATGMTAVAFSSAEDLEALLFQLCSGR